MKNDIMISDRKAAFVELEGNCIMSNIDSHDFIEVTEWTNGEGWDVTISASTVHQCFHLTRGQLRTMKKLVKSLNNFIK